MQVSRPSAASTTDKTARKGVQYGPRRGSGTGVRCGPTRRFRPSCFCDVADGGSAGIRWKMQSPPEKTSMLWCGGGKRRRGKADGGRRRGGGLRGENRRRGPMENLHRGTRCEGMGIFIIKRAKANEKHQGGGSRGRGKRSESAAEHGTGERASGRDRSQPTGADGATPRSEKEGGGMRNTKDPKGVVAAREAGTARAAAEMGMGRPQSARLDDSWRASPRPDQGETRAHHRRSRRAPDTGRLGAEMGASPAARPIKRSSSRERRQPAQRGPARSEKGAAMQRARTWMDASGAASRLRPSHERERRADSRGRRGREN